MGPHLTLAAALCLVLVCRCTAETWRDKYGAPGKTDPEGFNPYADTVGAGVYSGSVELDQEGRPRYGSPQYQDHCQGAGPIYDGRGYAPISRMIGAGDIHALDQYLSEYPNMSRAVLTGGATPLHTAGMSTAGQRTVETLLRHGARPTIDAHDTCGGYTPLQRMASNGLTEGAAALLKARASVDVRNGYGQTALQVAEESRASAVVSLLRSPSA